MGSGDGPFRFGRRQRLLKPREFRAVYDAGVRRRCGPLVVFLRPNGLDHCRLGLSVPRRVGGAVARNRIKRRLREVFRLHQHRLPGGYDVVVNVQPHPPLTAAAYEPLLVEAARAVHRTWSSRASRSGQPADRADGE